MNAIYVILLIALAVALIIFGPIFTIWALNLLFGTGIMVNFFTWLSMVWLQILVGGAAYKKGTK